jgi:Protein of unknown function (DUF2478)
MQHVATAYGEDLAFGAFRIGALRGAPTPEIQCLLWAFVERRRLEGVRVVGVLQVPMVPSEGDSDSVILKDLVNGATFPVFQELGTNSTGCSVDPGGLAAACQSVLHAISEGADLVVLSKFGKLEEAGTGLLHAFGAAAEAGIPCLTGVAPAFAAPFLGFAGDFAEWVEASDAAVESWWASRSIPQMASAAE